MNLDFILENFKLILGGVFGVALCIAIYNTIKGRKDTLKKFLAAIENGKLRKTNSDIVVEGTISTKNIVRAPYSNTQVAACSWTIEFLDSSAEHASWEIEKHGLVESSLEVSTASGHKYKIALDNNAIFLVTPAEYATFKNLKGDSNISEMFSSKNEPSEEQISKIKSFAQSNGVKLKQSFGIGNLIPTAKKLKISEWNLLSGTTYTIMGVLTAGNLIIGTKNTPLQIFEKGIAELIKDGPPDIY
jgi:hypothetical protein